ncbi:hypothetical protein INS49_003825 [Diaporthe citri]|uniref:uncharacterized protein n=1 Tax=Diaporthe citri TaxID=83186 RepID=UPI001C810AA0|nr:uncharacterized protein INS49_003825 [Diaporthe citri]KAG6354744.1 hypothetical protein INS49_003825 [Diaporthe citri]
MSTQTQIISSNMDTEVSGPVVLSGSDKTVDQIRDSIDFTSADNTEIKTALEGFKAKELNGPAVDASTFILPTVGPRLEAIAQNLHSGTGFSILRGFNTQKYTDEDNLIIFLGLGSYIGSQRGAQNKSRVMISHITDAKGWQDVPPEKRHGIHTNSALPFHTDMGCEVLTLLYRQVAAHGGATSLASAAAIYDDLLKQPKILETLQAANWPVQLSVKNPVFKEMPLLAHHEGHVISEIYTFAAFPIPNEYITDIFPVSADPGRLGLHPATAEKPSEGSRLNEAQLKALKILNDLAEKHAVSIPARPGDILFINNLAVLHKRDSYVDDDSDADSDADADTKKTNGTAADEQVSTSEADPKDSKDDPSAAESPIDSEHKDTPEKDDKAKAGGDKLPTADDTKRRWLMRLWLRNEKLGWKIPDAMKLPWEAAYGKDVGRLITPKYDPSPQPDYKEPRYTSGTAAWLIEDEDDEAWMHLG